MYEDHWDRKYGLLVHFEDLEKIAERVYFMHEDLLGFGKFNLPTDDYDEDDDEYLSEDLSDSDDGKMTIAEPQPILPALCLFLRFARFLRESLETHIELESSKKVDLRIVSEEDFVSLKEDPPFWGSLPNEPPIWNHNIEVNPGDSECFHFQRDDLIASTLKPPALAKKFLPLARTLENFFESIILNTVPKIAIKEHALPLFYSAVANGCYSVMEFLLGSGNRHEFAISPEIIYAPDSFRKYTTQQYGRVNAGLLRYTGMFSLGSLADECADVLNLALASGDKDRRVIEFLLREENLPVCPVVGKDNTFFASVEVEEEEELMNKKMLITGMKGKGKSEKGKCMKGFIEVDSETPQATDFFNGGRFLRWVIHPGKHWKPESLIAKYSRNFAFTDFPKVLRIILDHPYCSSKLVRTGAGCKSSKALSGGFLSEACSRFDYGSFVSQFSLRSFDHPSQFDDEKFLEIFGECMSFHKSMIETLLSHPKLHEAGDANGVNYRDKRIEHGGHYSAKTDDVNSPNHKAASERTVAFAMKFNALDLALSADIRGQQIFKLGNFDPLDGDNGFRFADYAVKTERETTNEAFEQFHEHYIKVKSGERKLVELTKKKINNISGVRKLSYPPEILQGLSVKFFENAFCNLEKSVNDHGIEMFDHRTDFIPLEVLLKDGRVLNDADNVGFLKQMRDLWKQNDAAMQRLLLPDPNSKNPDKLNLDSWKEVRRIGPPVLYRQDENTGTDRMCTPEEIRGRFMYWKTGWELIEKYVGE